MARSNWLSSSAGLRNCGTGSVQTFAGFIHAATRCFLAAFCPDHQPANIHASLSRYGAVAPGQSEHEQKLLYFACRACQSLAAPKALPLIGAVGTQRLSTPVSLHRVAPKISARLRPCKLAVTHRGQGARAGMVFIVSLPGGCVSPLAMFASTSARGKIFPFSILPGSRGFLSIFYFFAEGAI